MSLPALGGRPGSGEQVVMEGGSLLRLVLAVLAVSAAAPTDPTRSPRDLATSDGSAPLCVLRALPEDMFTRVDPPGNFQESRRTGVPIDGLAAITVNYIGSWPAEALGAFQYAADILSSQVTTAVAIVIDAEFKELDPGILGSASAHYMVSNFTGAPVSNTWYAAALANKLAGHDLYPMNVDVRARFSSEFRWYYGTDGSTPQGHYDFVSVVLHELCHGLGYFGSARVDGDRGYITSTYGFPIVYDRFVESKTGRPILSFASGGTELADELQGQALYWSGSAGVSGADGIRPRLYAPATWVQGVSYSHLNEATYPAGNPNSLMTYAIGAAEAIHDPGPITRGMFTDTGWTTTTSTCSYTVTPTTDTAPAAGAVGKTASVTTTGGCTWTAVSNAAWIAVTGGASGSGSGTVTYTVAANSTTSQRVGTLTIAGKTLTVTQVAAAGGPLGITITEPTTATTYTATAPWLRVAGTATGSVVAVTWTNSLGGSGTATGTANWNAMVPLKKGTNVITVQAADADPRTAGPRATVTDTLTVTVAVYRYSIAEGATGPFFRMDLLLGNPNAVAAPVTITFLKEDGTTVVDNRTLGAWSRTTLTVNTLSGLSSTAVSAVVQSNDCVPILVERTMFWNQASWYGGHTGSAVDEAKTKWYFGEGSQGFFDTYVLLANSNATAASVTVTFLRESETPVVRTYTVNATSRVNVFAGAIPDLVNRAFSIVVDSNLPIIAERAMYFGGPNFWEGGHESAGVPYPATSWFHAEGATGAFFDTYILIGNPNSAAANVTMTYLLSTGASIIRNKTIPGNSRLTVNLEGEGDARLLDAAVATTVTADIPVISERAMYWAGAYTSWYEAHNSFGVTDIGTKWGLAEGAVGYTAGFETYILLANPSTTTTANVRVTYMPLRGASTIVKTYTVAPTQRVNIHVNSAVAELGTDDFSALIEVTNGVPIAVERAMYWTPGSMFWTGGTNATAIRLP